MQVGSIVFHDSFKFGRIIDLDGGFATVSFFESGRKSISEDFLNPISDAFVNYVCQQSYNKEFPSVIRKRGHQYYAEGNVTALYFSDNTIFGTVLGSDDYNVKIEGINSGKIKFSCDCPYSGNCKHIFATFELLREIFDTLIMTNVYSDNLSDVQLSDQIIRETEKYDMSRFEGNEHLINIKNDLVEHLDEDYFKKYLDYVDSQFYRRDKIDPIYSIICYTKKFKNIVEKIKPEIHYLNHYQRFTNALSRADKIANYLLYDGNGKNLSDENLTYYFYNEQYEEFLVNCLKRYGMYAEYKDFLAYCCDRVEPNHNLFETYHSFVNRTSGSHYTYLKNLFSKFTLEQKMTIYNDNRNTIKPKYMDLLSLEQSERRRLIPVCELEDGDVNRILQNEFDYNNDNPKEIAAILTSLFKNSSDYDAKNLILLKVSRLKNNDYFGMYLNNIWNDYSYNRYYKSINYESFTPQQQNYSNINIDAFNDYFDFTYTIEEKGDSYDIVFSLLDATGEAVIQILKEMDGTLTPLVNRLTREGKNKTYLQFVADYTLMTQKEAILHDLAEVKRKVDIKVNQKKLEHLANDLSMFDDNEVNKSITLVDRRKAHLEYYFNLHPNEISLSFKVGIDKPYIIKNPREFLDYFNNEETVKYGKNFELTHKIENFVVNDQKVLDLLTKFQFPRDYYYMNSRDLSISKNLFNSLMDLLKNESVFFNEESYLVRLDLIDAKVKIDRDFYLRCEIGDDDTDIYFVGNRIYAINTRTHYVDYLPCSKKEIALYQLAYENKDCCIKPLLERFKNSIYARYNYLMEIDEEIKDDFKLSVLDIHAYFDYSDKSITVENKYFIDDAEISLDKVEKTNDLQKIDLYNQYLSSLGFIENVLRDDASIISFFSMDFSELKQYCKVFLSESIQNKQLITFTPSQIRIKYENNLMQAVMEKSEFSDDELDKIIKAIRRKKKYVQLSGDRIIDLSEKSSEEFVEAIDDIGMDSKNLSKQSEISITKALKAFAYQNNFSIDDYLLKMINDIRDFKNSDVIIPDIQGELRSYQKDGYRWLKILSDYHMGGILADDMGLGKTIQVITLITSDQTNQPNLIVCPKSLVFNWKNEFNRFSNQEKAIEIYGNKTERLAVINKINPNEKATYITSYDSLRSDYDDYKCILNYLIIDEAQFIKNTTAQKTQSVKQMKAIHKFALTGTPIENNIIDLWSIFDFIMPGYLEELSTFKSKYSSNDKFVEVVAKRIAPFVLRRTKNDVLKDLPEKYERVLSADMTVEQRKLYDAHKKLAKDMMNTKKGAFDILPYLTRLRQICVDPSTFVENYEGQSGKMILLQETIDEYLTQGHRILIFSQFVKALNIIEEQLKKKEIPYFMITGETDGKKRIDIANEFNNNSKESIVLISLKAGGTGLNLIGADTVIHLDPWWNVSAENQATDRTHRIGQKKNVEVIRMICAESIEQRVIELQNMKKDLIDRMISNSDESVINSSLENIQFILD